MLPSRSPLPRLAVLLALAAACAPARVAVRPDFWQNPQKLTVGVALAPPPEGGAHKVGAQGLLDAAINNSNAEDLQARVRSVDLSAFGALRDGFVGELRRRAIDAKGLADTVDPARFPEWTGEDAPANRFERDLGALRERERVDVLVLLSIRRYGTIRSYYGFIPLGAPKGLFEVRGQMIDLKTGELLWQAQMPEDAASVETPGEWDQPPDYPNVMAALHRAIEKGRAYLWTEFFSVEAMPDLAAVAATPAPARPAATAAAPAPAPAPRPASLPVARPAAQVAPAPEPTRGLYEPVPYLTERGQKKYQEYLKLPLPRAFAIAETGHFGFAWGDRSLDLSVPPDPRQRALQMCEQYAKARCRLYSVDDEVVLR